MSATKAVLRKLAAAGIEETTHHATIKKAYKAETGEVADKNMVEAIRVGIANLEAEPAKPAKKTKESAPVPSLKDVNKNYPQGNILRVTALSSKGTPARVIVSCQDPQTLRDGTKICEGEREIAIQDMFQVCRCETCQKRHVQIFRNTLARQRRERARVGTSKAKKRNKRAKKSRK